MNQVGEFIESHFLRYEEDINDVLFSEEFEKFYENTAYLGFKPEIIIKDLMNRASLKGRNLLKDAVFMVSLLAFRGSLINKMIMKMPQQGKIKVSELKSIYSLQDNAKGNNESLAITLPRVALAFPWIGIKLFMARPHLQTAISINFMNDLSKGYPKLLMAPGVISLIPSKEHGDNLACAIALHQIYFSRLISSKKLPIAEVKEATNKIIANARSSTFIDEGKKIKVLEMAELIYVSTNKKNCHFIHEEIPYLYIQPILHAANIYAMHDEWAN